MMYVCNSTRVTATSINSAPDLDALSSGRALLEGGCDDSSTLNPSRGSRISSAAHNTLGRVDDDVSTSSYAHVSICTTSSSLNGASPLTPHLRANAQINKKGLPKSCQKNIIKCTDFTYIGTLNVRTIRLGHKQCELAHRFANSGLEMMAIQEHRIIHDEPTKTTVLGNDAYLLTSSAWRNAAGASTGGVGILLTKRAHDVVTELHTVSPRIFGVTLDGNPRCTAFSVYSPTECASDDVAEEFHNELRATIASIPAHNLLAVGGDFNAHVGKEDNNDKSWYYHERTNRNGRLLKDTLLECEMENTNTRFQKHRRKMWTHLSDGTLTKSQIDFILVRKKWRNSVKDTEAYNFFNSLGSDHRLVRTKLKLSLRKAASKPKKVNYDWDEFKRDNDLQKEFALEVRNRYSVLCEEDIGQSSDHPDITNDYSNFASAIASTCDKNLPKRQRRRRPKIASDTRVNAARTELDEAKNSYHNNPNNETRHDVKLCKDALASAYNTVEEELLDKQIKEVERLDAMQMSRQSWSLINEISGRKKSSCAKISGNSAQDRVNKWQAHFKNLLGEQPPDSLDDQIIQQMFYEPEHDISTAPFTAEELREAKRRIKDNKACGEDGIPPEVLKRCDLDDIVLKYCNTALTEGKAPDQWKISNIIPVPKKGDLTKTDNYRGIALTSLVAKTLNRMILNRIQPVIEKVLRDNQNGFRAGRSTTSHILALRRLLEGANDRNLPAVLLFIDFKKAFDSIHRGTMLKILRAYGIPEAIVDLIGVLYAGTKAQIQTPDGVSELFDILAGVLQGDTLAPYIFIIVVDYCMRQALDDYPELGFTLTPAKSRRVRAEHFSDVEFADDIGLIANSIAEMQSILEKVETAANSVGLHMNVGKTKYMTANLWGPDERIWAKSGIPVEKKTNFLYLGSWIRSTESDIKVRKAKAWAACHKLKRIWTSNIKKSIKTRLFISTVESVLLYGSETWTLTKRLTKMIDGCYTRLLRMALNVSWKQRLTNEVLYGKLPKVSSKITERRLKLAGHIHRHPELTANKLLFWEPSHGRRNQGAPPETYIKMLRKDTGVDSTQEIGSLMLERKCWRQRTTGSREYHTRPR